MRSIPTCFSSNNPLQSAIEHCRCDSAKTPIDLSGNTTPHICGGTAVYFDIGSVLKRCHFYALRELIICFNNFQHGANKKKSNKNNKKIWSSTLTLECKSPAGCS